MSITPLLNRCYYKCSVPLALVSAPGQGKTAMVEKWAKANNIPFVKLLASSMDETDIAGIPVAKDNRAVTLTPQWVDKLRDRGVLFLDELNTARKEVQDTLLTLVQSRTLPNGDKIGDGVLIICAINPAEMCDNYEMSPAMVSRFMWVRLESTPSQTLAWLYGEETFNFDDEPAPVKYVTREMHEETARKSGRAFEADKRALMEEAISRGFSYTSDEAVTDASQICAPRALVNLLYWTENAFEMVKWAPAFLDENNASIIASVDVSSLDTVGNTIFGDKTGKRVAVNDEESEYIKQQEGILKRINGEVNSG